MPIGADLFLHTKPDHATRLYDGAALAEVIIEAADYFKTPLALPLMDLTIEKRWLLELLGQPAVANDDYHFTEPPTAAAVAQVAAGVQGPPTRRLAASCEALSHVAARGDLVAVGMAIGPFSLLTKLLSDPITAVFLAGSDVTAAEEPEVATAEVALQLATMVVLRSLELQVAAGARLICLCEPAANSVYLSPRQIEAGSDIFERFVMEPNRRIKGLLRSLDCDLMFHNCGELSDRMVDEFNSLHPVILSFGSSRKLWEDAARVAPDVVLFGNLPSRKFYSDSECSVAAVAEMAATLRSRMAATGHPFILGTECDVLSVPEAHDTIMAKVASMMH